MSFKFSKSTLRELNQVFDSIHLPGSIEDHTHRIIRKIFIEAFSIYIDVLKWEITSKKIIHIAAFIYREFKTHLYIYYLDKNSEYERLISNTVKFTEYCYNFLDDSFYKHIVLLSPFIKRPISKKNTSEIEKRREDKRKKISDTRSHSTEKMDLIKEVIDFMKTNECNFNYSLRKVEIKLNRNLNSFDSDKSTILEWAHNQIERNKRGDTAYDLTIAQEFKELKEKLKRQKPKKKFTS